MRTLSTIVALTLALCLVACAHKMPNPPDDPVIPDEIEQPPAPEPKYIGWPPLPGWEMVGDSDGWFTFYNPTTTAIIRLTATTTESIGGPEWFINELYQKAQSNENFEVSDIEFSQDRSIAYITFSAKLKEGEGVRKGKTVALLVPELPEMTAICIGTWPASVEKQMITDFDRLWMGIGLTDPPEDAEENAGSFQL